MLPDLPGWDSLPAVSRYHSVAEIAGIIILAALVLAEVAAYRYGKRRDFLTEQHQTAIEKRHDEEMTHLQHDTALAKERTAQLDLEATRAKVQLAELEEREMKRQMPRGILVTLSAIKAALVDEPKGRAEVIWQKNVPDGDSLAHSIALALMGDDPFKGWKIERVTSVDELPEQARPTGVTVIGKKGGKFVFSMFPNAPKPETPMDVVGSALMKGFDRAFVHFDAGFDPTLPDDFVKIAIGAKP